eukprot:GFUD01067318.1.p1 GENE.GFUD01067318.1~~GFUD01067318.1.p1  ORF type:complete len:297 (+),score=61.61 GFUD01067318.1:1-891(+)
METLFVETIIARDLVLSSMKKTTVVSRLPQMLHLITSPQIFLLQNHIKVKDAVVEIIKDEDVVLQRILVMKEKETVMALVMVVVMMVVLGVKEVLCVEAIIVKSLVHSTMKRTTAVKILQHQLENQKQFIILVLYWSLLLVKDAVAVIIKEGDAVLQKSLVMKEKETVTDLLMVVVMMATQGVKESWYVGAIIARSLVLISTRKTIVVRILQEVGVNGRRGAIALKHVEVEDGDEEGVVQEQGAETSTRCRGGFATHNFALLEGCEWWWLPEIFYVLILFPSLMICTNTDIVITMY